MKVLYTLSALLFSCVLTAQTSVQIIAPMNEFRTGHGAAMLEPGIVLAAGGWDGSFVTPTAEVYDYANDTWDLVINMTFPRTDFALVSLDLGKAIAAGGWDGMATNLAATEIFDLATGDWSPGPDLVVGRANLRATQMLDGKVLFTGGFDGVQEVATAEIYDPALNTITQVADMLFPRSSHEAMLLPDGRVLVAGGFNPNFGFQMNQCEIYNPQTNTWSQVASLNAGRDNFTSIPNTDIQLVIGGRFFDGGLNLFTGLETAEYYNVADNVWTTITLPYGHSYSLGFDLMNGSYYSVGGADHTGFEVEITTSNDLEFVWGFADLMALSLDGMANANTPRYRGAKSLLFPPGEGASSGLAHAWLICGGDENNIGQAEIWSVSSLSIDEPAQTQVGVFPNPTTDRCVITGIQQPEWIVYNALGEQVAQGKGEVVEVFGLTAGCYTLHAYNSSSAGVSRFFVIR